MTDQITARQRPYARSASRDGDPFAPNPPDPQDVLDALDDPDCRTIIEHLETPMTATELSDACGIPCSTMYRKLTLLSDAALLDERIEFRTDGKHRTRYVIAFDEVRIVLDDARSVHLEITRRDQTPEERLSELWAEVRKRT